STPFKAAEFDVMFGSGICRMCDMIDLSVAKNIINKTGAWFSYKVERLGQGRDNAKVFLNQNQRIATEIESEVHQAYNVNKDGLDGGASDAKKDEAKPLARVGAVAKDEKELATGTHGAVKPVKAAASVQASAVKGKSK